MFDQLKSAFKNYIQRPSGETGKELQKALSEAPPVPPQVKAAIEAKLGKGVVIVPLGTFLMGTVSIGQGKLTLPGGKELLIGECTCQDCRMREAAPWN